MAQTACEIPIADGGKKFEYLAYNQVIKMQIPILGEPYLFPHVTANTVKREP